MGVLLTGSAGSPQLRSRRLLRSVLLPSRDAPDERFAKKHSENTDQVSDFNSREIYSFEPSPEELLISSQNLDHVLIQIKSLKKEYRTILKLRYFDDLSLKQIEETLDESSSTVRVKLFRAKKMLANKLDRE